MKNFHTLNTETRFGISKLELMLNLLPILNFKSDLEATNALSKTVAFLENKINRTLSNEEYLSLLKGIESYVISDPATNERSKSMKYLFNLEFIKDDNAQR